MKKSLVGFLLCFAIFNMFSFLSFAQGGEIEVSYLTVVIDGKAKPHTNEDLNPALVKDGRTFLPLRVLMTDLGIPDDDKHIIWNKQERSIKVTKDSTEISLQIDSKTVYVNGKEEIIDAAPFIYKDTTYIPLRFVSQSLGKKVVWDEQSRVVLITDNSKFYKTRESLDSVKKSVESVKVFSANATLEWKDNENVTVLLGLKIDKEKEIVNMKIETETFGNDSYRLEKAEMIYCNGKSYNKNYFLNKWKESNSSNKDIELILKEFGVEGLYKFDDTLCAYLDMEVGENEVKFTGTIIIDKAIGDLFGSMSGSPKYFEMIIDKNTNYIKSIKVTIQDEESKNVCGVQTISFTEFNEMVKTDTPKESDIYVDKEALDKYNYRLGLNLQKALVAYVVDTGDSELKCLGDDVDEIIVNLQKEVKVGDKLYGAYLLNPLGDKEPIAQSYKPAGVCWNIEVYPANMNVKVTPSETDKLTINRH
ncbi:copper amine oxidase N-terminal domain-containing protein [Acetivibrio cellulolyticus]|uniref:copper amine oxidase N-terminal domain-containing protein n=1 Tax=Acetivibrio cellulolyticus TaxID=35830 RepID=UPI0001E2D126|nr:copper amine oxidase N-terminal domain-containing protein [Acetivibrio cellulolyticus]